MTARGPTSHSSCYALGSAEAEQERLIRQAARLAPLTERLFREAGIAAGQRVLDLGSGVGDVAMLVASLVGPEGEVVAVERDARSIERARTRVFEAGLRNVTFMHCDANQITSDRPFDAAVGRLILEFVPDPVVVLRSLSRLVRPGGVVAFHEVSHDAPLALAAHLPLWAATVSLSRDILRRSGANTEMGPALHRIFQEAGLPAPNMHLEMLLGSDPDFTRWGYDVLCSLRPQIEQFNVSIETLGDFDSLPERLQAEVATANTVVPSIALVGAWSQKPI